MRGILTDNIQKKAKEFLKREITVKELRLYPYIDYSIKNNCQGWSFTKITPEEKEILDPGDGAITITAIGKCSLNHYMGNVTPQVMLEDFDIVKQTKWDF